MYIEKFKKRLTDVLFYPKLCKYEDVIENVPQYLELLNRRSINGIDGLVIYIHVPFCNRFCFYCSYFKEPLSHYDYYARKKYFEAICKELRMYKNFEHFKTKKVKAIQFGGGTPSLVEPDFLRMVIQEIKENFNCAECELITMEGNPASLLKDEKLEAFYDIGVQRLSIGVQTFNKELRKKLLIESTVEQIYEVTEKINKIGYRDYSMDLMYNLPGEKVQQVVDDIQEMVKLGPKFIDIYSLNIFPNTKFKEVIDKGNYFKEKPSEEKNILMTASVINTFKELKYNQVMSFTYSKEETKAPPHVDYFFNGGSVLGLGPSSRSYLDGVNFRNVPDVKKYMSMIDKGEYPIDCGMLVSKEEQDRKKMVFFPLYLVQDKSELEDIQIYRSTIDRLKELGYISEDDKYLHITEEGKKWTGNIATCFFSQKEKAKHNISFLKSMKENENPYNQDAMGVSMEKRRKWKNDWDCL